MWCTNNSHQYFVTNKVTIDLNMLGPLVKGKVSINKDRCLVITMHRHKHWGRDALVLYKRLQPYHFMSGSSHSSILSFRTRTTNDLLLSRTSSDKITSYICAVPYSRFLISFVPNISSIRIGLDTKMIMTSIYKPFARGTLNIHKNS